MERKIIKRERLIMSMKEAFDTFFEKLDKSSLKALGKHPSVPYLEGVVSKDLLLLDTLDKNGYVVWKPELQKEKISFDHVEKELGFVFESIWKK